MVYRAGLEEGRSCGDVMLDMVMMTKGTLEYFVPKSTVNFPFTKFSKTQLNFIELQICVLLEYYQTKINLLGFFSFDDS